MTSELYQQLQQMCNTYSLSSRIECIIMELMQDAYDAGIEEGMKEQESKS